MENDNEKIWLDEERAYAVVTTKDGINHPWRTGLSHASAMLVAEQLQREGGVSVVMHVLGEKTYEVDRYPVR